MLAAQQKPMTCNTAASMKKLTCTDYLAFGKRQDKNRQISWSKKDSNYLDVKHKVFKRKDNKDFRLVQNLAMGDSDLNKFMRLRNKLVIATKNFVEKQNLPPYRH